MNEIERNRIANEIAERREWRRRMRRWKKRELDRIDWQKSQLDNERAEIIEQYNLFGGSDEIKQSKSFRSSTKH